ncbi:MAG: hypothetical protein OXC40_01955 [Proteobacteria bacterium]|nr:hypothetical protein [Pseudomonadota bacterium]
MIFSHQLLKYISHLIFQVSRPLLVTSTCLCFSLWFTGCKHFLDQSITNHQAPAKLQAAHDNKYVTTFAKKHLVEKYYFKTCLVKNIMILEEEKSCINTLRSLKGEGIYFDLKKINDLNPQMNTSNLTEMEQEVLDHKLQEAKVTYKLAMEKELARLNTEKQAIDKYSSAQIIAVATVAALAVSVRRRFSATAHHIKAPIPILMIFALPAIHNMYQLIIHDDERADAQLEYAKNIHGETRDKQIAQAFEEHGEAPLLVSSFKDLINNEELTEVSSVKKLTELLGGYLQTVFNGQLALNNQIKSYCLPAKKYSEASSTYIFQEECFQL